MIKRHGRKEGARIATALADAASAFEAERFAETRRHLAPLADRAADVPEVRELFGLTLYRLGRWKEAVRELEAFRSLTGTTEQHPVLADSYRALGRWADVDELWVELRESSPSAALVTEGRIVAAGALADQKRLDQAVNLLAKGWRAPSSPAPHHLRRAYALADLYERSGSTPRARELFRWVAGHDPQFADAAERLAGLG